MAKKAPRKSAIAPASTKRPNKETRAKTKGGHLTIHHPPALSPKAGADERRAVLKWRAMELKIQGRTLRDICAQLKDDFELVEAPAHTTVDDWLDEAFAEVMTAKQVDADRHCSIILMRGERLISNLLPIAMRQVAVSRTRVRDGQQIEVIDENAIHESLAATAEIRKLMDQQAKLLKIGRVGEGKDGDGNGAMSGHAMTLLVEQTVTQHIHLPGQTPKSKVTLVLESGDGDVDALDRESVDVEAVVTAI